MTTVEKENSERIGPLQSQVIVTIHTIQAMKLWQGRKATDPKLRNAIMGLPGFISRLNAIHFTSSFDDPYADWALITVEDKYKSSQKEIANITRSIEKIFQKVPKQISISDNLNINPIDLTLISKSPLGFSGVYLLTEYDELIRKILQLRHIGLIGRTDSDNFIRDASRIMRSFYSVIQYYKNAGVARDDIAANNARARQAIERLGLPPKDILEGTRRSEYAPVIHKRKLANTEPVISDEETEHFVPDQEENAQSDQED